jgi:hypothetical protein
MRIQFSMPSSRAGSSWVSVGKRLAWGLGGGALWLVLGSAVAAAASPAQDVSSSNGLIWTALLPFVTASVTVERIIELGWNYLEWGLLRFAGWNSNELKLAAYVQFKSGTSLLAGIILGILVSNYTGLRLLALFRPELPNLLSNVSPVWDIILTGIVIGAGSKPAHDILLLLTQVKNFMGNNALKQRELAGAAMAESIQRLGQANVSYTVDVPGVGPTAIGAGSARAARSRIVADTSQGDDMSEKPTVEEYADLTRRKLYS